MKKFYVFIIFIISIFFSGCCINNQMLKKDIQEYILINEDVLLELDEIEIIKLYRSTSNAVVFYNEE